MAFLMSPYKTLALVGCGAVARRVWVPALGQVDNCSVEWFVDNNLSNAKLAASEYGRGNVSENHTHVIDKVEAAIIAVPNNLHSPVSMDFLRAGRGVLCEKPIANTSQAALEMIAASKQSGARLAINYPLRRYEGYRAAKILTQSIGTIRRINCKEGHRLAWPFSTSFLLQKVKSGGGVLIDWGSHKLDTLSWLFGYDWDIVSYKDDGFDGIETNCEADFLIKLNGNQIPCHLELSYDRTLGKTMEIEGDLASIFVDESHANQVHIRLAGQDLVVGEEHEKPLASYFAEQIRSFVSGLPDDCLASGEEALRNLQFVEACYGKRRNLIYPWKAVPPILGRSMKAQYKRLLIVGASGFLGTRLAEVLASQPNLAVRATFHRPDKAVRLAQLPIELVECDLLDSAQVAQAVQGCDVIVNCAIGRLDSSEGPKATMEVFGQGTRNLLDAAKANRVRRFVHVSSAAVHGFGRRQRFSDESAPFKPRYARNPYEKGKILQDKLVMEFAEHIPVVVLRPTLIYGPYSEPWLISIVDRLKQGVPCLVQGEGIANFVFVDDVVEAILLALEIDNPNGKAFIINNDREVIHWKEHVSRLSDLTGCPPVVLPAENLRMLRLRKSLSMFGDSLVASRDTLGSREMLSLLSRIPLVVALGSRIIVGQRRKKLEQRMSSPSESKRPLKPGALLAKYETMSDPLHENLTCRTVFSSSYAKSTLGWEPRTMYEDGWRMSREWAKWAGLGSEPQE